MLQLDFIRSNTFRWASAVAGVLAAFVIVLFAFIYWKIDHYLIARSDRMIAAQISFLAQLPDERRIDAIADHIGGDSRGVLFAGLFGPAEFVSRTCKPHRPRQWSPATRERSEPVS